MHMTFRWFGPDDPIPLANIRQIPGVTGIVTALSLFKDWLIAHLRP